MENSGWYILNHQIVDGLSNWQNKCSDMSMEVRPNNRTYATDRRAHGWYRVFIKYCVFPKNVVIYLNSASSAAALVFYMPGVCTHTDTEGEQRKTRVRNILKSLEKNTILNENPVVTVINSR